MFRNYKPSPKTVNIVLMNGGVGDHIGGSLIALKYMIKRYPWITYLIWMPDFLVDFAKNVLPEEAQVFGYNGLLPHGYDPDIPTRTTEWDGVISPMKIHQVDYAFLKLCDELPNKKHKESLKVNFKPISVGKFNLPERYVILTTGYTAEVREFPASSVNELLSFIRSKGYAPIFLGQEQTATGTKHIIQGTFSNEIDYKKGLNLCNKTTLLEAAKIMQGAKAVLGVDNGLLHVAACTDAHIIAGYTTVRSSVRAPYRKGWAPTAKGSRKTVHKGFKWHPITPDRSLACRFCQSNSNFLFKDSSLHVQPNDMVDYKKCYEKDLSCVKQMTADKFIAKLSLIL